MAVTVDPMLEAALSPELVLVSSPELALRARLSLPDFDAAELDAHGFGLERRGPSPVHVPAVAGLALLSGGSVGAAGLAAFYLVSVVATLVPLVLAIVVLR